MNGFQQKQVEKLLNGPTAHPLNQWEVDFLRGIKARKWDDDLSDLQNSALNRLMKKL